MYSLHLSAEQIEIRDTVRDFVSREIRPAAIRPARLEASERPLLADLLDRASRMGLRTLALSEARGGAGADTLTCCIVTEELAAGDPDIAAVLAHTAALGRLLERWMTPAQCDRFLPPFTKDDRYHLAWAGREPGGEPALGIHYHRPASVAPAVRTTAVRSGGDWVIRGVKSEVANAPLAKLFAVQVRTPERGEIGRAHV